MPNPNGIYLLTKTIKARNYEKGKKNRFKREFFHWIKFDCIKYRKTRRRLKKNYIDRSAYSTNDQFGSVNVYIDQNRISIDL